MLMPYSVDGGYSNRRRCSTTHKPQDLQQVKLINLHKAGVRGSPFAYMRMVLSTAVPTA